jgi:hypothetical protein
MTQYPNIKFRKYLFDGKLDWFIVDEHCEVRDQCGRVMFVITKDFVTDFASVPRWLWSVFPPHGKMTLPSVVHDYMYDFNVFEDSLGDRARKFADDLFLINCIRAKVPIWQAVLMYSIIRLFGKSWWTD